jgi:hypothetical protein
VARGRGWRFAQLGVRCFLGLVHRVVAPSPVVAAPEGGAGAGSAGWGRSAGVMYPDSILPGIKTKPLKNKGIPVSDGFGGAFSFFPFPSKTITCQILRYLDTSVKSVT